MYTALFYRIGGISKGSLVYMYLEHKVSIETIETDLGL